MLHGRTAVTDTQLAARQASPNKGRPAPPWETRPLVVASGPNRAVTDKERGPQEPSFPVPRQGGMIGPQAGFAHMADIPYTRPHGPTPLRFVPQVIAVGRPLTISCLATSAALGR